MVEVVRLVRKGRTEGTGLPARFDASAADGAFEGYASLFGVADRSRDVVARGAFARSLRAKGVKGVRMLYQHLAQEPIGVWTEIFEDPVGLFARGRILPGLVRGRETLALLRAGALDGLSIGFRAVRARTEARTGVRTIYDADLWEISVVTFPMLDRARVTAVA